MAIMSIYHKYVPIQFAETRWHMLISTRWTYETGRQNNKVTMSLYSDAFNMTEWRIFIVEEVCYLKKTGWIYTFNQNPIAKGMVNKYLTPQI